MEELEEAWEKALRPDEQASKEEEKERIRALIDLRIARYRATEESDRKARKKWLRNKLHEIEGQSYIRKLEREEKERKEKEKSGKK